MNGTTIKKKFESAYGVTANKAFKVVNPIKKKLVRTPCIVHQFINEQALEILKLEDYDEVYLFYKELLHFLNQGAVWADQDFKSINHFFHYTEYKGLYGFSDALTLCLEYYNLSREKLDSDDLYDSIFYLGAACHLIQDSTVPHHVSNKLLKQHRHFEQWIIYKVVYEEKFRHLDGIIKCESLESCIKENAKMAYDTYLKCNNIYNIDERYDKVASSIIMRAKSTTAGVLLKFYEEEIKNKRRDK
ncbi:zinc dependent phospholipase C family protein [Hathewaya histolytica]|uniref:Phospholipase C n=1 Tax=Hathewaya histolytica TaxID=1498 RepID=A0A4U9R7A6_HATHI|nr:zinc dependent phospholipase C family protein [Hathewaya histolytica]VTQ87129.1 putative phospholipase C [Hathewaya histolytica]